MDWSNIVITLITSGTFATIYFLGDKKTAAVLENVSKTIDQWQELVNEMKGELTAMRTEMRDMKTDYENRMGVKENKIDSLWKENGVWRDKCDKLGSKVSYYRAFECRKVKCLDREPPFGSGAFNTEECEGCQKVK